MSESVDQRACQGCGAQNRKDADFCWQCYTPFRGGPFSSEGRTAPLARTVSGRTATAVPTEMRPAERAPAIPPAVGTIIRLVVVGGLVASGWFAWQHFRGFPFPSEIRGVPRIESSAAQDELDTFRTEARELGVEVDLAVYGTSVSQATYGMGVLELPEADFWEQVGVPSPIPLTPGLVREAIAAQTLICVPGPGGASCIWIFDDSMVVLSGLGQDVTEMRPVAEEVRAQTE